jgi:hypothetical protein
LAIPALRPTAARAISETRSPAFVRAMLEESRVLLDPEVVRGCHYVKETAWFCKEVEETVMQEPRLASGAARCLAAIGGASERRYAVFREWLASPLETLRREVVEHLVQDPREQATLLLSVAASRESGEVVGLAARELERRTRGAMSDGRPRPHRRSTNSESRPRLDAFATFWQSLDSRPHQLSAPNIIRSHEEISEWRKRLDAKLSSENPADRAKALRAVRLLVDGKFHEAAVRRLARDPDAAVRAQAVALLAESPGVVNARILREAMHDPDPRVQANAVEALDRLDAPERLEPTQFKLNSRHARVRANAVKSLLRLELFAAGDALLNMLNDAERSHRVSALWVVERLHLRSLRRRIDDLARNDPDVAVRRRATRVIRTLSDAADRGEEGTRNGVPPDRRRAHQEGAT